MEAKLKMERVFRGMHEGTSAIQVGTLMDGSRPYRLEFKGTESVENCWRMALLFGRRLRKRVCTDVEGPEMRGKVETMGNLRDVLQMGVWGCARELQGLDLSFKLTSADMSTEVDA